MSIDTAHVSRIFRTQETVKKLRIIIIIKNGSEPIARHYDKSTQERKNQVTTI